MKHNIDDLVRVKDHSRIGQIGRIIEQRTEELYEIAFFGKDGQLNLNDYGLFPEDRIENATFICYFNQIPK